MRRIAIPLALAFVLTVAAPAVEARTLGATYLGGLGVKPKPKKIGVGAKGLWEGLAWKKWGDRVATARGIYDIAGFAGQPGTGYRSRVFVKALGKVECLDGDSVYTRVRYRVRKPIGGRRVFESVYSTCPEN